MELQTLISAKQSAEAQMMGGNDTGMMKTGGNITGTVDLMSVISEAIGSKINVSRVMLQQPRRPQ